MPPPHAKETTIDEVLTELPKDLGEIGRSLRSTIRKSAPSLKEAVKWGNPTWIGEHNVIFLMIFSKHLNLGFFRGVDLLPKYPQLEGTGKGLRHLKMRTLADARDPVIPQIIRDAVRLDSAVR